MPGIDPVELTAQLVRCASVTPENDGALEILETWNVICRWPQAIKAHFTAAGARDTPTILPMMPNKTRNAVPWVCATALNFC